MDNALRTISYIADIGNIVVLMARRRMPRTASQDCIETTPGAPEAKKQYKMICHVFESEDVSVKETVDIWGNESRHFKAKLYIFFHPTNEKFKYYHGYYQQFIKHYCVAYYND